MFKLIPELAEIIKKEEIDVFINLAAIVGDPACGLQPEKAIEVNYDAAIKYFKIKLGNIKS